MVVSVFINTKDRSDVIGRALSSVAAQSIRTEIVVLDDGSSDDTCDLVSSDFPSARLIRNDEAVGIIAARNQGLGACTGQFVLVLDDDAELVDPTVLERAIVLFENPRVAVVALRITDVFGGKAQPRPWPRVDAQDVVCAATFPGGASIMRKSVFERIGGLAGTGRQAEESDYTLRLLDSGWLVRLAPAELAVRHYPEHLDEMGPQILASSARNRLLSVWSRTPLALVPIDLLFVVLNHTRLAIANRCFSEVARAIGASLAAPIRRSVRRRPVRYRTFITYRRLVSKGAMTIEDLDRWLGIHGDVKAYS